MDKIKMVSEPVIWLVLMPLLVGFLPSHLITKKHKRISTVYLCGWLLMVSIFQIVATFFVVKGYTMTTLALAYAFTISAVMVLSVSFAMAGLVKTGIKEYFMFPDFKHMQRRDLITWIAFFVIVIAQIVMSLVIATPNGDDAQYVTMAVIADQKDKLFTINAYTGMPQDLHLRHALAQFTMFYGFLARLSGIHAAVIAHTVMPIVLIPITYMIYGHIAIKLFNNDRSKLPVFMVLIALINMFGATSIYTNEVFFLTRTWQGKSMLANIAIPATFDVILMIAKETEKRRRFNLKIYGLFLMLFLVNLAGAFASSLGILLLAVMELVFLAVVSIRNINYRIILMTLVSMIPCYIYIFLYMYNLIYYYLFQRV